jgi:lambda family phage portal protein
MTIHRKQISEPTTLSDLPRRRRAGNTLRKSGINSAQGRGAFDAGVINRYNKNHFANASSVDIDSLINADREQMVKMCRYEYLNNAYIRAMAATFANEIVGTGPTLQMQTGNDRFDSTVEEAFAQWAQTADSAEQQDMAGLLNTGCREWCQSGEELSTFINARTPVKDEVQMRIRELSPARIANEMETIKAPAGHVWINGVLYHEDTGAAASWKIYKALPNRVIAPSSEVIVIDSKDIIHVAIKDQAEQHRGYPLLAPTIPLAADLRRYTKAVVAAAEQAANISGVITSTSSADNLSEECAAMDEIQIARNALLTMPKGWDINQFKAEQPTSTYKEFKHELLGEIGRALFLPFLLASGNASGYNYSSGRLDLQDWWKTLTIIRAMIAQRKLDRILARFLREAILIPGLIKGYTSKLAAMNLERLPHTWNWPGHEHVDPKKEADAQTVRLSNNTSTLAIEWGRQGRDWEREIEQIAREKKRLDELGLTAAEAVSISNSDTDEIDEEELAAGENDDADDTKNVVPKQKLAAATAAVKDVAKTALNGAQIASLVQLAVSVATGELSQEVATAIIKISLPDITDEEINNLIAALNAIEGKKENTDATE